jgi:hypothetical protein
MSDDQRLADLQPFVGRLCVYIEDGVFSIARVAAASATEEGMAAVMDAVPELPLVCHYCEDPPRFVAEPHPIGQQWEIGRQWDWFYPGEEYWDGSPYLGVRALFATDVVERFLARDLSWIDDYF